MASFFDLTKPHLAYYSVSSALTPHLSPPGEERSQTPTLDVMLTVIVQGARGIHVGDGAAFLRRTHIWEEL